MELIVKNITKIKDDPFLCVFTTTKKIKGVLLGPLAVIMYKALRQGDIVQAADGLSVTSVTIKHLYFFVRDGSEHCSRSFGICNEERL